MPDTDAEAIAASFIDPAAFAVVFDRHAASIHRFLARRVEPSDAENILGEVFRIAFERRATFDLDRPSARPWLYGIATNLIARYRRSEARRLRATLAVASLRTGDQTGPIDDRASAAADAGASWASVVDAIDRLPHADRDTLLLFAWEELSYEEIAAALDIPVGTVRSRLNRARARLRARLGDDVPGSAAGSSRPTDHDSEEPAR
jgi:RNA polymerase sigma factor (sigma-70 family)